MCNENPNVKIKRMKPEDFIGWASSDGNLRVVGIHGKQGNKTLFKVTCEICSRDKELFPDGYFVSLKDNLIKGRKPCGCSKQPKWKPFQYLLLARRAGEKKGFIVHGFAEEFHGQQTRLDCECLIDKHRWRPFAQNVINAKQGCPKCSDVRTGDRCRTQEKEVTEKCKTVCQEMNYKFIGFPSGYKNQNSRFEYECPKHGIQNVNYNSFVRGTSKCILCWRDKQKELTPGFYGLYSDRLNEQDFLYVLNFDNQYIKVGRSFDVDNRIKEGLIYESGLRNVNKIHKLRVYTATHKEIWDLEQELHSELKSLGFYHHESVWSDETFNINCVASLNKLLDNCCSKGYYRTTSVVLFFMENL